MTKIIVSTFIPKIIVVLVLAFSFQITVFGQFISTPPTINFSVSPGEYGTHTNGSNRDQGANGGGNTDWYCTWDNTYIYFAVINANESEIASIYLDLNPTKIGIQGTNADGNTYRTLSGSLEHSLPFRADVVIDANNGNRKIEKANGSGGWTTTLNGSGALCSCSGGGSGDYAAPAFYSSNSAGGGSREFRVKWTDLNASGRPASFRWLGMISYSSGTYAKVPRANPGGTSSSGAGTGTDNYYYYSVLNTADGTSTMPFEKISFTAYDRNMGTGADGNQFDYTNSLPSVLYDFSIDDLSANNNDNDPIKFYNSANIANRVYLESSITIQNDLYIGVGSSLTPKTNTTPSITMNGANGHFEVKGRLGSNPDDATTADVASTDLRFIFAGTTNFMSTGGLSKDRVRFSDVTVNPGAAFQADATAGTTTELEFQDGTITNNGVFNFYYDASNHVDVYVRGDIQAYHNVVTLAGSRPFTFHDLAIGRRPSSVGSPSRNEFPNVLKHSNNNVTVNVKGNFSCFSELVTHTASAGTGRLDFVFNGNKPQTIYSTAAEVRTCNLQTQSAGSSPIFVQTEAASTAFTASPKPRVIFHNLTINNNGNDVFIDTYDESTANANIELLVTGALNTIGGDLVTRLRSDVASTGTDYHKLTLMSQATTSGNAGAKTGTAAAYFVDGPVRWEIDAATTQTKDFPTGKENGGAGAGYRVASLSVENGASNPKVVYEGELVAVAASSAHSIDASSKGAYATTETIAVMPAPRHWKIHRDPDNVIGVLAANSASVQLNYLADDYGSTNDPLQVRVVKTISSSGWINVSGSANTGSGDGSGSGSTVSSDNFTTFSSFSIGVTTPTLPVKMLAFNAVATQKTSFLTWVTASEENNAFFIVERSTDGQVFEAIGRVKGNGTTATIQHYNFQDENPAAALNYYRLRQVDVDGRSELSEVRLVSFNQENTLFTLNPNPIQQGIVQIHLLNAADSPSAVDIFDVTGKLLLRQSFTQTEQTRALDVAELPSGVYILRVTSARQAQAARFVID